MYSSRQTRRVGWPSLVVGTAGLLVAGVLGGAYALEWVVGSVSGDHACNDRDGNPFVETAFVDALPAGTLRGYMNIGPDCAGRTAPLVSSQARSWGSIAAGWQSDVRPADVVDRLVRAGWARTDPAGGAPSWYTDRVLAGDPIDGCLGTAPDAWQDPDQDEIPSRACNQPTATQIALVTVREERVFVARLNVDGLTVDTAHRKDREAVRAVRERRVPAAG